MPATRSGETYRTAVTVTPVSANAQLSDHAHSACSEQIPRGRKEGFIVLCTRISNRSRGTAPVAIPNLPSRRLRVRGRCSELCGGVLEQGLRHPIPFAHMRLPRVETELGR